MRSFVAFFLVSALAACGGGGGKSTTTPDPDPDPQPQPDPDPVAAGPTCAGAAANAIAALRADEGDDVSPDQYARLEAALTDSCASEPWPDQAVRCVAEASAEDLERCETTLPEDMGRRVGELVRAILDEGHGDGGVKPPA